MANKENHPLHETGSASSSSTPPPPENHHRLTGFALRYAKAMANPNFRLEPQKPFPFNKELYFFYGSLNDPAMLTKVLDLKEPPLLRTATITGYHCKLWGPYPALLEGPREAKVEGVTFEVQSAEQVKLLRDYETKCYKEDFCLAQLEDGSRVPVTIFVWNSDLDELDEGVFDPKNFQKISSRAD